jgi:hypothetical protein
MIDKQLLGLVIDIWQGLLMSLSVMMLVHSSFSGMQKNLPKTILHWMVMLAW